MKNTTNVMFIVKAVIILCRNFDIVLTKSRLKNSAPKAWIGRHICPRNLFLCSELKGTVSRNHPTTLDGHETLICEPSKSNLVHRLHNMMANFIIRSRHLCTASETFIMRFWCGWKGCLHRTSLFVHADQSRTAPFVSSFYNQYFLTFV